MAPTPRAAPAPIPLADSEACHGRFRINRQPLGLCINCGRFSNGTPPTMEPEAVLGFDGWDCPNRRSLGALIDAETVDAVDETMNHAAHCAPVQGVEEPLHVGPASAGCADGQQHTGGVSTS